MNADDLAPLLSQSTKLADLGFHTGEVTAWDPQTGNNTVRVLGTELVNLPALNLTEMLTMTVGAVVGLLRFKSTFFILGRVTQPNTAQFFSGAMPAMSTAFYPVNTDGPLQTDSADGVFYPKMRTLHVINHPAVDFGVRMLVSGGTCVGSYKVQWFLDDPGGVGDPVGGTTMAQATGIPSPGIKDSYHYEWPAGMRGESVYIAYMPAKTAGAGADWVSAMPEFFNGVNS